jgi:glycosyltransferase involved in cell wall biosynthesis
VAVLHPPEETSPYPPEVHHRIRRDEAADYRRTARALGDCVDVVSIQHSYRIWGGEDGAHVVDFVRALDIPTVTTLHTVLRDPTPGQRAVLMELVAHSAATVVLSRSAATLLTGAYGIDAHRVTIIPHGVPELPLVDPETIKPALGLAGRQVILSFGLLGPGKGCESVLDALPAVVSAHPTVLYAIVGATDPELARSEEEAYREALVRRTAALGLTDHVQFVDRFVGRVELIRWLEGADVVVTAYSDLDRNVSGALSYSMGAGRAIVSTSYAYAAELLADGRGVLVPPNSRSGLATALKDVLGDPDLRVALGKRAYEHSRPMVWSAIGAEYRRLFDLVTTSPQVPVHPYTIVPDTQPRP